VIGVELVRRKYVHTRKIAHTLGAGLIGTARHDENAPAVGHLGEERLGALRRRRLAGDEFGDRVDPPVACAIRQGAAQRRHDHLLRCALAVVPRLRAVHGTAAGELRRARRTLTGAASAFLAIRLPATAAHVAAGLGGMRTLPGRRALRRHHLMHQRDVGWRVEQLGRQVDRAVLLAARCEHIDLQSLRGHYFSPRLIALRTMTSPPRRPGMAPLISSTPFSASTLCTTRFCVVTRSLPIRPAIRVPLNTRAGVAQPPIEPGRRWTACAPWLAPWPRKPCRFIVPAVPLPLGVPVTST